MTFNNPSLYGFPQPYNNPWTMPQQYPQPQIQPQQYQQQAEPAAQANNNGIIWVQGEAGAKAYIAAPGCSVFLMDSENSVFYIKSTDQSGMPLPLRIFDYRERTAEQKQTIPIQDKSNEDYVTRKEFDAFVAQFNAIARTAHDLKGESENG